MIIAVVIGIAVILISVSLRKKYRAMRIIMRNLEQQHSSHE